MKIGQLSFHTLDAPAERPYGHPDLNSKYVGQSGPVASQYQKNAL
jgi:dCTP deaminase